MRGRVSDIYDETEPPHVGACLRYMPNLEPESPNE